MSLNSIYSIVSLNKKFGLKTVLFEDEPSILGYSQKDTIYLNKNSDVDLIKVNKHELLHFFENTTEFLAVKNKIISSFDFIELENLKAKYELKYFGLYNEKKLKNLIETEIAIDVIVESQILKAGLKKSEIEQIFLQSFQPLKEKRYLNIGLSKQLSQQFNQLNQWEKLFVLNFYNAENPLPKNKATKYVDVRNNINTALNDLYSFIENKNNFTISFIDNPYLEKEFESEIKAIIARGNKSDADYILNNKEHFLKEMSEKFEENLYAELKHIKDFISNTNYEPAFKYLMLNETLTKIYRKERKNNSERTIIEKRELNKSVSGHMILNSTVLDTIYSNLDKHSSFSNLYFTGIGALNKSIAISANVKLDNVKTYNKGKWIKFEGKNTNKSKYIKNSKTLASLVHNTPWCTKQLASSQLEEGDFYVFVDSENKPHIAVKLLGNEIDEVRGLKNGNAQELEDEYRDVALSFLENNKQIRHGKEWLEKEEYNKTLIEHINLIENGTFEISQIQSLLNNLITKKDYKNQGKENSNKEKLLSILHKIKPQLAQYYNCTDDEIYVGNLEDSNLIDKYKIVIGNVEILNKKIEKFKKTKVIFGNANFLCSKISDLGSLSLIAGNSCFYSSQVDNLGALTSIGGNADFLCSKIKDLKKLVSIGGKAYFKNSQIYNLENLITIGGNVYFGNSQIKNLGKLVSIDGNAYFKNSQVKNLGALNHISGDADFENSQIDNLENLITIGGNAYFGNSQIKNLGKLISIDGNADFKNSQVKNLGALNRIGGDADFVNSQINNLGNLTIIGGNAYFGNSQIKNLGKLVSIDGNADFKNSQVKNLGALNRIGGDADFVNSQINNLGNLTTIGGNSDFIYSEIKDLGALASIGGDAYFGYSQISDLSNLNSVGGSAYFGDSKIRDLKKLVFIGGEADFINSQVTNLSNLSTVGKIITDKSEKIEETFKREFDFNSETKKYERNSNIFKNKNLDSVKKAESSKFLNM